MLSFRRILKIPTMEEPKAPIELLGQEEEEGILNCLKSKEHFSPLTTKRDMFYSNTSPYRAVNTLRLGYKNQPVNVV
jgi:hypothetical protein